MATKAQKAVKKLFTEEPTGVYPDKVVCKKDGTVELKKSYFYTFGESEETWAGKVAMVLAKHGAGTVVGERNDYADWPKTSYFVCIVRPI